MNYLDLNIQIQCKKINLPIFNQFYFWITTIIDDFYQNTIIHIGLQLVREKKMQIVNKMYRKQDSVTNIIAFRYNDFLKPNYILLGDILICHDLLLKESKALHQPILKYYAFIIIHGMLHLLDFNHIKKIERKYMQSIEDKYLTKIGF